MEYLTMANQLRTGDPYDTAAERTSILGPTLRFKGELHADEELLIQGQIEGSITHSQRVTVCGQGTVKASIRAQIIAVEGTVEGDMHAEKSVQIKETAHVNGNIQAPNVSIVDGAKFNGNVNMEAARRSAAQAPSGDASVVRQKAAPAAMAK
jgi:cytoskeletal protein CcmA (bactofilin family)